jgi:outer membrane protein assembly factor BamB
MGALWVIVGVGVASLGVGIWLFARMLTRRRYGQNFGAFGCLSLLLLLAGTALLAGYVPLIALPNIAVETAVFNQPAPVDASATVFYLSQAAETLSTSRTSTYTYTLIGVAARTGAIRWQRALPSCQPAHAACVLPKYAVADGIAYVAVPTARGITVAAYRGTDGALLWQTKVSGSQPVVAIAAGGDTVYVLGFLIQPQTPQQGQSLRSISALRASDGVQRWSSETLVDAYSTGALLAAPDAVYLTTPAEVQTYRASDGRSLWNAQPDPGDIFPMLPVAAGGVIYLPTYGSGVSAVRASDGSRICKAGGNLAIHAIALAGSTLYVAAALPGPLTDGHGRFINPETVYAYDATTCMLLRQYAIASASGARALIAGGDTIYVVMDNGGIHAVRTADGKELWHRDEVTESPQYAGWAFAAQPVMLGDTLFVTSPLLFRSLRLFSSDGQIHVFAIAPDGSDYWHTPVGHVITFSPRWTL